MKIALAICLATCCRNVFFFFLVKLPTDEQRNDQSFFFANKGL